MRFRTITLIIIPSLTLFMTISCLTEEINSSPSDRILQKCLEYSIYTDPGEFEYLYDDLPESIEELCDLIKKQLVHPFDIEKFGDAIQKERAYEDREIPSVEEMLKELLARDSSGLVSSRQPQNRLVVACVHHSLLLASILRHKKIPVRIRAGNAKYIGDDERIRVTHAICEVWDAHKKSWILVDPDRHKIDFSRQDFEFAAETWDKLRNEKINEKYYISRYKSVDQAAAHLVWLDLSFVTGTEEPYWNDPPIVTKIEKSLDDLSGSELQLLDNIASLLKNPDNHFDQLVKTKENNSALKYQEEL